MKFFFLLSFLLSLNLFAQTTDFQELKPFASDYCSKWPEGKNEDPTQWADCCFTHDLHYWLGGTDEERKGSDKELKNCVKLTGASIASFLMYIGVRIGGNPGDESYAWGFGWKNSRGYEKIPPADLDRAKTLLENSEYNQHEDTKELISNFINNVLNHKISNDAQ
jgi:hypothetical protein